MKLESRMRQSIKRRKGTLIFRSDVSALGSQTQVTHALDALIHKGELLRIARGIYAKANRESEEGPVRPKGSLEAIINEFAQKFELVLHNASRYTSLKTKHGEIVVDTETPRVSRTLIIDGKTIHFQSCRRKRQDQDKLQPLEIPRVGIDRYVQKLARRYKVSYTFSTMDKWAESVTRLAGDEVRRDHTEDLIVALKRAGKISKQDVARLTVNYLRERKQSV